MNHFDRMRALRASGRRLDARERAERLEVERIARTMPRPVYDPPDPLGTKTSAEELERRRQAWAEVERRRERYQD